MFELNGSDTSWLVYADYLEDQGIDATYIREGVIEQQINTWNFECSMNDKVGGSEVVSIYYSSLVGSLHSQVGPSFNDSVGGEVH